MSIDVNSYREQVSHLGKFEAEPPETPYYYDQCMNGDGESYYAEAETAELSEDDSLEGCTEYTLFTIDAEEAEAFDLTHGYAIAIWEDSQGFVMSHVEPTHEQLMTWIESRY
jgi:hypothetical protein